MQSRTIWQLEIVEMEYLHRLDCRRGVAGEFNQMCGVRSGNVRVGPEDDSL